MNDANFDKKEFVLGLVKQCHAEPEDEPAAIFMAGLPGAGKTELSRSIIEESGVNFFRIDMDEIAEMLPGYNAKHADEFRKPATKTLNECLSYALHHNISFIMDGTFGSKSAKLNIERCLKHGFRVKIVYAFQDPKLAWEFTLAREKVEHRAIKFDGFVEAYYKTINNIKSITKEFKNRIVLDIAIKRPDNRVGEWKLGVRPEDIDEVIGMEYNKDKLIKYIIGN